MLRRSWGFVNQSPFEGLGVYHFRLSQGLCLDTLSMVHNNLELVTEGRPWLIIQSYFPALTVNRDLGCGEGVSWDPTEYL